MAEWNFLTNHGRAFLCIARQPEVRLRDIASKLDITERHAYSIVNDLTEAEYIIKEKDGRRNWYQIQNPLPPSEPFVQEQEMGEILSLLAERKQNAKKDSTPGGSG
jgi:Winged helix DNA-binding domain